jgi:hypothetical protein
MFAKHCKVVQLRRCFPGLIWAKIISGICGC